MENYLIYLPLGPMDKSVSYKKRIFLVIKWKINSGILDVEEAPQVSKAGNGFSEKGGCEMDRACGLCNDPLETRNHLFFSCRYFDEVWSGLTRKLLAQNFSTCWDRVIQTIKDRSLGKEKLFLIRYTFQLAVHSLWKDRNNRRHGEISTPPTLLICKLDKEVHNRISSIRVRDRRYDGYMLAWLASRWTNF